MRVVTALLVCLGLTVSGLFSLAQTSTRVSTTAPTTPLHGSPAYQPARHESSGQERPEERRHVCGWANRIKKGTPNGNATRPWDYRGT